MSLMI